MPAPVQMGNQNRVLAAQLLGRSHLGRRHSISQVPFLVVRSPVYLGGNVQVLNLIGGQGGQSRETGRGLSPVFFV
jgi:hypothetical protein